LDGLVYRRLCIHQSWASPDEILEYVPPEFDRYGVNLPRLLYNNLGSTIREDASEDREMSGTTPENVHIATG